MAELLERLDLEGDDGDFARDVLAVCARAKGTDSSASHARSVPEERFANPLSDREAEILALLAERLSDKEIAEHLHITPETVKRRG